MPAKARYRAERGTWEVVVHAAGESRRESIGKGTPPGTGSDAERRAIARAAEINADAVATVSLRHVTATTPLPTDATVRAWFASHKSTIAHSTEQTRRGLLENHVIPFFGSRDMRSITKRDAIALAEHMVTEGKRRTETDAQGRKRVVVSGLAAPTAREAVILLHQILVELVGEGAIESDPLEDIAKAMEGFEERHTTGGIQRRDSWEPEEVGRILALAEQHEAALFPLLLFCFYTGARRGEAIGMQWDSIDFENERVEIRRAVVRGRLKGLKGKKGRARKPRLVSFAVGGAHLRTVLAQLAEARRKSDPWRDPDYVFLSPEGKRWQERNVNRAFDRLRRRFPSAGIRPLVLHCTRHTFASVTLQAGATVKQVGEWLGHTAEYVTEIYVHAIPSRAPRSVFEAAPVGVLREVKA